MTDFDDIGGVCCIKTCKKREYCIYGCQSCKKIYCFEHRTKEAHDCPVEEKHEKGEWLPQCPLCKIGVEMGSETDPDVVISQHIDRGCDKSKRRSEKTLCAKARCKQKEFVPAFCRYCSSHYCMTHRHPSDHACNSIVRKSQSDSRSADSNSKLSLVTDTRTHRELLIKERSAQGSSLAQKLLQSRHRSSALGDSSVPAESRFFLEVCFPLSSGLPPSFVFFRNSLSIGRILDDLSDRFRLSNTNHIPGSNRLHIFHLDSGLPLNPDLSLRQTSLKPYDAILLEYSAQ